MISIILPSIRSDNLKWALGNLRMNQIHTDYEVICPIDFQMEAPCSKVKILLEPERKGVIDAINVGLKQAQGDYIYITNDQSNLSPDGLNQLVKFSKSKGDVALTGPKDVENFQFKYYDRWFVAYPFIHRTVLNSIGGHFDPIYRAFYADPDLSLRAHVRNIPVEDCTLAVNKRYHSGLMNYDGHQDSCNKYFAQDKSTFINRWKHLGEYKDC